MSSAQFSAHFMNEGRGEAGVLNEWNGRVTNTCHNVSAPAV